MSSISFTIFSNADLMKMRKNSKMQTILNKEVMRVQNLSKKGKKTFIKTGGIS
jgi:hypothetical protein